MGCNDDLRCKSLEPPMSALGHSRPGPAGGRSSNVRYAPKATVGHQNAIGRDVPKADILHRSNNAGLLGQVLPNFRQRFSFDTYFFPPASGKIHMATIMKAAVARMKFPNSGRTGEPLQ
jgi:hypothetical protein